MSAEVVIEADTHEIAEKIRDQLAESGIKKAAIDIRDIPTEDQ